MNNTLIVIIILFVISCFVLYKLTWKNRTTTKIKEFEMTYNKNIGRRQKDYCSTTKNLDKRLLCDYYVCSSRNPHLTGFLNYDYSSNTYLGKIINYGCRYIELDIFAKDIRIDSEPVVSSGGKVYQGQNYILFEDVIRLIGKTVFSKNMVDNFRDPFFIYLNVKTDNTNLMDNMANIIKKMIGHNLLKEKPGINVGKMQMCELMDKIVLFGSDNTKNSNLKDLVSLTPNSEYLQRIEYDSLPTNETLITEDTSLPTIAFSSSDFKTIGSEIIFNDSTNPVSLGITPGMKISFNSHDKINIEQVSNNTIQVDQTYDLGTFETKSDDKTVYINVFKPIFSMNNILNFNKRGLTIVYFDEKIFPDNKDPIKAWQLGCQFIAINFQKIDFEGMRYIKSFHDDSFLLKPSNLRNTIKDEEPDNNKPSVEYPDVDLNQVLDNAISDYFQFTLKTIKKPKMFVHVLNNNLKITPIENDKTIFVMEKGKELKSISITYTSAQDKLYLTAPKKCCYLSFTKKPSDPVEADEWIKNTTFYPIQSRQLDGNISFMCIRDNKPYYITQREPKMLDKQMKLYQDIIIVDKPKNNNTFLEPAPREGYKILGHNFSKNASQLYINYYAGAISAPTDFKSTGKTDGNITIYKPVPSDGYVSAGYVAIKNNLKGDKLNREKERLKGIVCCVRDDKFTKVTEDENDSIEFNLSFGLGEFNGAFYFKPKDTQKYNYKIDLTKNNDDYDRLFLSRSGINAFSATKVDFDVDTEKANNLDISPEVLNTPDMNRLYSYKIIDNNANCLTIKNGYWSKTAEGMPLEMKECVDNYTPNEFVFNSNMLQSKLYPEYCVQVGKDNFATLTKCSPYDQNQLFDYTQDKKLINEPNDMSLGVEDGMPKFFDATSNKTTWNINQKNIQTINDNDKVAFVLARVPRMKAVYHGGMVKPILDDYYTLFENEFIDDRYFHIWIKCNIEKNNEDKYVATPIGMMGAPKVINNSQIVLPQSKASLNLGDKVIVQDGTYLNFSEANVRWDATVIEKMKNGKIKVLMSPNSVEPNYNKFTAGRPRIVTQKILSVDECIPNIPVTMEQFP